MKRKLSLLNILVSPVELVFWLLTGLLVTCICAPSLLAQEGIAIKFRKVAVTRTQCSVGDVWVDASASPAVYYSCPAVNAPSAIGSGGGSGTVTTVSVVTANGFSGTVADPTTTPAITLSCATCAKSSNNLSFFSATSSAQLLALLSDPTGTGVAVFNVSPVLTTPNLGTPSAATLTNATGLPITTGVSGLAAGIAAFLATPTSANLAAAVTDEAGSGSLLFGSGTNTGDQTKTCTNQALTILAAGTGSMCSSIAEAFFSFTDVTTANASTSAHGLLPKLDNVATHFLNGQGGYTTPATGAACASCTPNVMQKGNGANTLQDSGIVESVAGSLITGAGVNGSFAATAPTAVASTTAGATMAISASNAVAGTTNAGAAAGGAVTITAGSAAQKTSGSAVGGNINLTPGTGIGGGVSGLVVVGGVGIQVPNGSANATAIRLSSATGAGLYTRDGSVVNVADGSGNGMVEIGSSGMGVAVGKIFGWATNGKNDSADTAISRGVAGVMDIGTGAAGSTAGWVNYNGTGRVASDLTNATATMSNITLSQNPTVIAGRKYVGRLSIKCNNSSASEGIAFDFAGGSATFTSFAAGAGVLASGGTDVIGTNIATSNSTAITFTTLTGESWVVIEVAFVCNAAGTVIPRFAENSSTVGTATVRANSFFTLTDTP